MDACLIAMPSVDEAVLLIGVALLPLIVSSVGSVLSAVLVRRAPLGLWACPASKTAMA